MRFLLIGKWFWWHNHAPGSLAQLGCQQIRGQDDPGHYQDGDPRLAHSSPDLQRDDHAGQSSDAGPGWQLGQL